MFRRLLATGLPTLCSVCQSWSTQSICPACLHAHGRAQPRCPHCALPLAPGLDRCHDCTQTPRQLPHRCLARVHYEWPWTQVVAEFKFQGQSAWSHDIAQMMLEQEDAHDLLAASDALIPIPLSRERLLQRGYNQSWELAKHLAQATQTPARSGVLLRLDTAQLQHRLAKDQRQRHASRAFTMCPESIRWIQGLRLVLIDDVMTTGATLEAAAHCLLASGAREVNALVFARTPKRTLEPVLSD